MPDYGHILNKQIYMPDNQTLTGEIKKCPKMGICNKLGRKIRCESKGDLSENLNSLRLDAIIGFHVQYIHTIWEVR